MEKKLRNIFDFQRFSPNSRLAKQIAETESRYGSELSEDALMLVNAAGEPEIRHDCEGKTDDDK